MQKQLSGADGRDRLVCGSGDCHQGNCGSSLYLLDPGRGPGSAGFFGVEDTTGACEPLVKIGTIEWAEFVNLPATHHVRIVVFARLGQATVPAEVIERSCSGSSPKGQGRDSVTPV
jgi:hypothetical protein